ncbi:MAG TPA: hypothetical protein VGB77_17160 [Abditibacteriaceae bacterium]
MISFLLVPVLFALSATAFAKPSKAPSRDKITEIVLDDHPGLAAPPTPLNKIVLYADGRAVWLSGTTDNPVRRSGRFNDFVKLSALFEKKFFSFQSFYPLGPDVPFTDLEVVRAEQRKQIRFSHPDQPLELWGLEMAVRGVASTIKWQPSTAIRPASKSKTAFP